MSAGREQVRRAVVHALSEGARRLGTDPADLDDDTDVLGSGLIDSLGFVDLVIAVEAELGRPLALERLDFERIDDLGALVEQLLDLLDPVAEPAPPEAGAATGS